MTDCLAHRSERRPGLCALLRLVRQIPGSSRPAASEAGAERRRDALVVAGNNYVLMAENNRVQIAVLVLDRLKARELA